MLKALADQDLRPMMVLRNDDPMGPGSRGWAHAVGVIDIVKNPDGSTTIHTMNPNRSTAESRGSSPVDTFKIAADGHTVVSLGGDTSAFTPAYLAGMRIGVGMPQIYAEDAKALSDQHAQKVRDGEQRVAAPSNQGVAPDRRSSGNSNSTDGPTVVDIGKL